VSPRVSEISASGIGETRLPTGVKDFLPVKAAKFEYLQATLRKIFTRWGFRPVIPAPLEDLAVLELGLGSDLRDKTFRFDDRQTGRLVAVPPDITPQVARIAATRLHDLPLPYRLCYSSRVLRHAEQRLGKEREIWQTGVELIGLESPEADAEMIAMAVEGLLAVGAEEFTIDIGQVAFLRGILDGLPLDAAAARELRAAIAVKDSGGLQQVLDAHPVSARQRDEVLALPRLFGGRDVLERAAAAVSNEVSRRALDNLHRVLELLNVYGVDRHVTIDLGELRGFDYHTGVIFQGFLAGYGRAVCSGGRYDGLTGRYGLPAPATGFAFDLFKLLFALDRTLEGRGADQIDILLFCPGPDKAPAQRLAAALRGQGYSVARDIIARDREASIEYARRMHFRMLLIMNETSDGLTLLHLADGQETALSLTALLAGEGRL